MKHLPAPFQVRATDVERFYKPSVFDAGVRLGSRAQRSVSAGEC